VGAVSAVDVVPMWQWWSCVHATAHRMSGVTLCRYPPRAVQPASIYFPGRRRSDVALQRDTLLPTWRCASVNTMAGHNSRPGCNMWLHAAPIANALNLEHLAGLLD